MAKRNETLKQLKADLVATARSGDGDGGDCSKKVVHLLKAIIQNEEASLEDDRPGVTSEVRGAVQLVVERLDSLSARHLVCVLDLIADDIRHSSSALDVLETGLSMIVHSAASFAVDVDGDQVEMSGQEYRDAIVTRILEQDWDGSIAPQIVSVFRNSPITAQQGEDAVNKVLSIVSQIDAQTIPPLMYQLLLLASKLSRPSIFQVILEFCISNKLARSHPGQHRELEGTLIVHLLYTAQRDHKIGTEIFKHMRCCTGGRMPQFALALALAFANTTSFETAALDFLRKHVSMIIDNETTQGMVAWLWKLDFLSCSLSEFGASVSQVLEAYAPLTDGIAQGAVSFLLHLLSNKTVALKYLQDDADRLLVDLIQTLLGTLLQDFHPLRQQIVEKLLRGAVDALPWNFPIYARLLGGILLDKAEIVQPFALKCKEALESIAYQKPQNLFFMLRAVLPVLKSRTDFRDSYLIFARKLILWKDLDVQRAIISSLIELLKTTVGGENDSWAEEASSSQVSYSPLSESNAKLCKSVKLLCRKSVSQSPAVRSHLYSELALLGDEREALGRHVVDLLWSHSRKYWENGGSGGHRLVLSKCFKPERGVVMLEEPVADLIAILSAVVGCSKTVDDDDGLLGSVLFQEQKANLQGVLTSFVSWFSSQNIDVLLAFGEDCKEGRRCRISVDAAMQMLRVADACMSTVVMRQNGLGLSETVFRLEKLFSIREGMEQWFVGNSKAMENEKDIRKLSSMTPYFDPKTIRSLTGLFTATEAKGEADDVDGVKIDSGFQEFIIVSLERLARHWCKEGTSKLHCDDVVHATFNVFRFYLRECQAENEDGTWRDNPASAHRDEECGPGQQAEHKDRRDIPLKCLVCVEVVFRHWASDRDRFVRSFLSRYDEYARERESGEQASGEEEHEEFKRWVEDILVLAGRYSLDRRRLKEYELLTAILGYTIQFLPSTRRKQCGDKFLHALTSSSCSNPAFVRTSVDGCLKAYEREDAVRLARAMAKSLVEDENTDDTHVVDDFGNLGQLQKQPAESTATVIKRSHEMGLSNDEQSMESQEDGLILQQDLLFECVIALSSSMAYVLQKKQTSDTVVILSLECSLKLTRVFSAVAKIYMFSKQRLAISPPEHFAQLVEAVGNTFIEAFYAYIHYQQNKGGDLKAAKSRKIGKLIPEIIFEIEEYEKLVLILGKLAKVDYMHCIRKSVCRDFRFNFDKLAGNGRQASNSEQEENLNLDTTTIQQESLHEECHAEDAEENEENDDDGAIRLDSDGGYPSGEDDGEVEICERTETTWNMPNRETSQGTITAPLTGRRRLRQVDGKENRQPKRVKAKRASSRRGKKSSSLKQARRLVSNLIEDEASNSDGEDDGEDDGERVSDHSQGSDFPISGFTF